MDAITKVALQKFNQGKNAEHFAARRRDDSGSANIVRYLLDRLSATEYHALVANLHDIRKGRFEHKNERTYEARLDIVMPYKERPRSGSTRFDGELILEDVDSNTPAIPEIARGLRVVSNS